MLKLPILFFTFYFYFILFSRKKYISERYLVRCNASFRQRKQTKKSVKLMCERMINHCFFNYSFIPTRSSMPQSRTKRDQEALCRFSKSKIRSNVFSLTLWHPWNHWILWSSLLFPGRWSCNGIPRPNWSLRSHPQLLRVFFSRIWRKMVIYLKLNKYVMIKFRRNSVIKCNIFDFSGFPIHHVLFNKQTKHRSRWFL